MHGAWPRAEKDAVLEGTRLPTQAPCATGTMCPTNGHLRHNGQRPAFGKRGCTVHTAWIEPAAQPQAGRVGSRGKRSETVKAVLRCAHECTEAQPALLPSMNSAAGQHPPT